MSLRCAARAAPQIVAPTINFRDITNNRTPTINSLQRDVTKSRSPTIIHSRVTSQIRVDALRPPRPRARRGLGVACGLTAARRRTQQVEELLDLEQILNLEQLLDVELRVERELRAEGS